MPSKRLVLAAVLSYALVACAYSQVEKTLYSIAKERAALSSREGFIGIFPSTRYGVALYDGIGDGPSPLAKLESEIRRKMASGSTMAERLRKRSVAEALIQPNDERAVFSAMLSTWLWMNQRFQVGDSRRSKHEDNDRHGAAFLLAATRTKDPACLRLLLAYELSGGYDREKSWFIKLLSAGQRWLRHYPNHFELQRSVAYSMAASVDPKHWPEGDRMIDVLKVSYPKDLSIALLPSRIASDRFFISKNPVHGRQALDRLRRIKQVVPAHTTLADREIPMIESHVIAFFRYIGVKP